LRTVPGAADGMSSPMLFRQLEAELSPSIILPPYPESLSSIDTRRAAASGVDPEPTVMYPGAPWPRLPGVCSPEERAFRRLDEEEDSPAVEGVVGRLSGFIEVVVCRVQVEGWACRGGCVGGAGGQDAGGERITSEW
jgi:hypothetical protein